jgi:hypothetical protein
MRRIVIVIALVILVAVVLFSRHAWLRVWPAKVMSDGSTVQAARVYRNRSGDVLIDLRQVSGDLYVVRDMSIGIPNASSVLESPVFAIVKESPLRIVDLRTDKAGSGNPKLSMSSQKLSFVVQSGEAIQIDW